MICVFDVAGSVLMFGSVYPGGGLNGVIMALASDEVVSEALILCANSWPPSFVRYAAMVLSPLKQKALYFLEWSLHFSLREFLARALKEARLQPTPRYGYPWWDWSKVLSMA